MTEEKKITSPKAKAVETKEKTVKTKTEGTVKEVKAVKESKKADKFAIIKTGGKQYIVKEGDILKIEKLEVEEGEKITFDEVLLVSDKNDLKIGAPLVEGAKVEATSNGNMRDKKITVIRYKPKTRYTVKKGHRQPHTHITIEKITA